MKSFTKYEGAATTGKSIQLLGYSFLLLAALFLCHFLARPHLQGQADLPAISGEIILVTFSLGILLLFVGEYVVARSLGVVDASPELESRAQPSATD